MKNTWKSNCRVDCAVAAFLKQKNAIGGLKTDVRRGDRHLASLMPAVPARSLVPAVPRRRFLPPRLVRRGLALVLLMLSSLSVAAAPNLFDGAIENARQAGRFALDGEVFHVQGLAMEPDRIWVTSVDRAGQKGYLHLFDRATGRLIRRLDLTDGPRYHAGGISLAGHSLWVPVAENRPDSTAVLLEIDTRSLAVRRRIAVADHLGCVAVAGQTLVAGNWDSRAFHVIDLSGHTAPRVVANPSPTRYQDIKFVAGRLVGSGTLGLWNGAVDWLDWPSLRRARSLRAGAFGPGKSWTQEGMAVEGSDLYLLPEDGPAHLFRFRLDRPA